MPVDVTWPITAEMLRSALGYESTQGDETELTLFATAASQRIDNETGRDIDEHRHELPDGTLPVLFIMAARETAKLWWQQAKNGPRGNPQALADQPAGPPMGADLPRKVSGWLENYPPPPGFGQPIVEVSA